VSRAQSPWCVTSPPPPPFRPPSPLSNMRHVWPASVHVCVPLMRGVVTWSAIASAETPPTGIAAKKAAVAREVGGRDQTPVRTEHADGRRDIIDDTRRTPAGSTSLAAASRARTFPLGPSRRRDESVRSRSHSTCRQHSDSVHLVSPRPATPTTPSTS